MKLHITTKHTQRIRNGLLAILFVATQIIAPISYVNIAMAAGLITATDHEGQEYPGLTWSNGNITTYKEGDSINFRFTLTSSDAASGQMKVEFTVDDSCNFFEPSFQFGTINTISGSTPTVTPNGAPTNAPQSDWQQLLDVSFPGPGTAIVHYALTLSNNAGECGGSSQHSRLSEVSGDFANIGAQNVPIPAKDIIELPEIFVEKWIDTDRDGQVDRKATAGEWSFSLDGANPVPTDSNGNVVFTNVTPDGTYTITEHNGPSDQAFISGIGTNCTFNGSTATATVQAGTTSTDATCIFSNGTKTGSITIIKDAVPNNAQDFAFTTSGSSLSSFSLDDDGTDSPLSNTKIFNNLLAGTYTITETPTTGWDLFSVSCESAPGVTIDGATTTINLAAGQNVTCKYTNKKRGTITVNKVTDPANDRTPFSITASGNNIAGSATRTLTTTQSVTYDVSQGSYSITEDLSNTPGWALTDNGCSSITVNTSSLNPSCTITNTKLAKLTIIKDAINNDLQDFEFTTTNLGGNFYLDDDSDVTGASNAYKKEKEFSNLTPGQTYSVTETEQTGWKLSDLSCTGSATYDVQTRTVTFTPSAGQTSTCTFTNTKLGSLSGTKYEANADGSTVNALSGWTINLLLNGNLISTTSTDDNGDYAFNNLIPGSEYTVKEVLQSGWTQIYDPIGITLTAGQTVANQDFGNFKNGTISGYKWNDQDSNGLYEDTEPKLSGWTIYIDADKNGLLDTDETSATTDTTGAYSFNDLAPGTYTVCEVQQPGWTQTFPASDACHTADIDISGETETRNFGNQGRGTIQVIKNVDTDGDGTIDVSGATDWTWDINSNGSYATGSSQNVPAGSYTVSEDQKANYHVTYSSCSGETNGLIAETLNVMVSPGETVVCTFTNTRDTGTITIKKSLMPNNDLGKFNLLLDDVIKAENVSNDGTTGPISVPTGTYKISETAGAATSLEDYTTEISCVSDDQLISATANTNLDSITVGKNDNVICTITNTKLAKLTVVKDANPSGGQSFEFTVRHIDSEYASLASALSEVISAPTDNTFALDDNTDETLSDRKTINQLELGSYAITEEPVDGWDLTGVTCNQDSIFERDGSTVIVRLTAGSVITCTFTNTQRGNITILKDAQPNSSQAFEFTTNVNEEPEAFSLVDDGQDSALATRQFSNLRPGVYEFSEEAIEGWSLSNISCSNSNQDDVLTTANSVSVNLQPGDNILCTFTNTRDTGTITVTKKLTPATDTGKFNLLINGTVYAANIGNGGATDAVTVPTGVHTVSESAGLGTILEGYETTYVCMDNDSIITSGAGTTITALALAKGQNITCTFTNNIGEVLSVVTPPAPAPELADTGSAIILALTACTLLAATTGALAFATRRYSDQ